MALRLGGPAARISTYRSRADLFERIDKANQPLDDEIADEFSSKKNAEGNRCESNYVPSDVH
jgi:hypothetical protein